MIKKLFLFLVLLVVVSAALFYFFGANALNKAVKTGVERYGPDVTQTPVQLHSVNLSPFSGRGSLTGLTIGNPPGFTSKNIIALGEIDIEVEPKSLLSDQIILKKVHIRQPEISYERTLRGSNLQELLKNIESYAGDSTPPPPESPAAAEAEGAKKQVIIRELLIEEGSIYVGALGQGVQVTLPRIAMTDIGEGNNRKTIAQVLDLVLTEVFKSIGPAIANSGQLLKEGGQALLDGAREGALKQLDESATDAAKKASEGIKGLLGR